MVMTRLIGKWKVSQNQPPQNQRSVILGLNASGQSEAMAMVALVNAGVNKCWLIYAVAIRGTIGASLFGGDFLAGLMSYLFIRHVLLL